MSWWRAALFAVGSPLLLLGVYHGGQVSVRQDPTSIEWSKGDERLVVTGERKLVDEALLEVGKNLGEVGGETAKDRELEAERDAACQYLGFAPVVTGSTTTAVAFVTTTSSSSTSVPVGVAGLLKCGS